MVLLEYINGNSDKNKFRLVLASCMNTSYLANKSINLKGYLEELMLALKCEEDNFILGLCPVIFGININIIILQGAKDEEICESIILNNYNIKNDNLFLMNNFNGYSIIYTGEFLEQIKKLEIDENYIEAPLSQTDRVILIKGSRCVNCNKKKDTLKFIHMTDFLICKTCVQKYINSLILKRVKDFIKENLRNKECN